MNKSKVKTNVVTIILFLSCSLFMNAFYKVLSGFIANNFNDPLIMITMLIAYIVPVTCFLFYSYNYYVRRLSKIVSMVYSIIVIILSTITLVLISINIDTYISNNSLGVYQSIPSIIVCFPYDGIIISCLLIFVQLFNLYTVIKPTHKISYLKEKHYNLNSIKLSTLEYIFISVLAIIALFTVGDFVCSFNAIENVLYDGKYIFLILWVLIIPTMNLLSYVLKLEKKAHGKKRKIIYLTSLIFINILFAVLLLVFELTTPNFIVMVGKPLFPIAFSISFPVEMLVLLAIQIISIVINVVKIIAIVFKKTVLIDKL